MTTNNAGNKKLPTHEIFDVQDRERGSFWNKVGAAFENRDGSHSVLIYQPGLKEQKALQLRAIDRNKRPLKEGADGTKHPTHELFDVREVDGGDNDWKRIGVGFTNRDGSLSLVVDGGDRDAAKARFQVRVAKLKQSTQSIPAA